MRLSTRRSAIADLLLKTIGEQQDLRGRELEAKAVLLEVFNERAKRKQVSYNILHQRTLAFSLAEDDAKIYVREQPRNDAPVIGFVDSALIKDARFWVDMDAMERGDPGGAFVVGEVWAIAFGRKIDKWKRLTFEPLGSPCVSAHGSPLKAAAWVRLTKGKIDGVGGQSGQTPASTGNFSPGWEWSRFYGRINVAEYVWSVQPTRSSPINPTPPFGASGYNKTTKESIEVDGDYPNAVLAARAVEVEIQRLGFEKSTKDKVVDWLRKRELIHTASVLSGLNLDKPSLEIKREYIEALRVDVIVGELRRVGKRLPWNEVYVPDGFVSSKTREASVVVITDLTLFSVSGQVKRKKEIDDELYWRFEAAWEFDDRTTVVDSERSCDALEAWSKLRSLGVGTTIDTGLTKAERAHARSTVALMRSSEMLITWRVAARLLATPRPPEVPRRDYSRLHVMAEAVVAKAFDAATNDTDLDDASAARRRFLDVLDGELAPSLLGVRWAIDVALATASVLLAGKPDAVGPRETLRLTTDQLRVLEQMLLAAWSLPAVVVEDGLENAVRATIQVDKHRLGEDSILMLRGSELIALAQLIKKIPYDASYAEVTKLLLPAARAIPVYVRTSVTSTVESDVAELAFCAKTHARGVGVLVGSSELVARGWLERTEEGFQPSARGLRRLAIGERVAAIVAAPEEGV